MFKDLKSAWINMIKRCTMIADQDGLHVVIPNHIFERFEQEFNLCFVDEKDDKSFQAWQDKHE